MTALTRTDLIALRKADSLCVHLGKNTMVRAIKRADCGEPFARDLEHIIPAEVGFENIRGRDNAAAECFAMVNLYPSQKHSAVLILRTLREGDELTFSFYPDAHSNGYMAAAGLHGDALMLHVRRDGKQIAHWELCSSCCPSNSARMVRNVPDTESYHNSAIEARKVA